jgi:hypothetical protein
MGRIWNIVELLHRVAKVKFDNTQSALYRAWCMQVFSMFKFLRERERECVCVCVCVCEPQHLSHVKHVLYH